ncbi:MAG: hypothetical protein ACLFTB_00265 [Desulfovibrionales bacterium]
MDYRRTIIGILVVALIWFVMDLIIHGLILRSAYEATELFRPEHDTKTYLLYLNILIKATVFVLLYAIFGVRRGMGAGLAFGLLYGFAAGFSMGYASYAILPMPYIFALTWFLGTWVEYGVAGAIVGGMYPTPERVVHSPSS